jgi:hypothetical protein
LLGREPVAGRRWGEGTDRRTDVRYPEAERIVLVLDTLNTLTPVSLYEAFPPAEVKRWPRGGRFITRPSIALGSIWPG